MLVRLLRDDFREEAEILFDKIISHEKGTLKIDHTEEFMKKIYCTTVKAPSTNKTDITIEIHDHRTDMNPTLGFSIKSALKSPSTLINASGSTNFTYVIDGMNKTLCNAFDNMAHGEKIADRYAQLTKRGVNVRFSGIDNKKMEDNLTLLDSDLPQMVSEMLKLHYVRGISDITEQIKVLNEENPLGYRDTRKPFYEIKIRRMLGAFATGIQPNTDWDGIDRANGGYIIVKKDGEVLCYHLYNRNEFEEYLIKNTRLETPSKTRWGHSKIISTVDGYSIKMTLQVRFKE